MIEDAVGRVQRQTVGTVGGRVVSDDAELLAIGGKEEVVAIKKIEKGDILK